VESKWKNYHITTLPGQSLSKNRETQFGRGYEPVARQTNTYLHISMTHEITLKETYHENGGTRGNNNNKSRQGVLKELKKII
jgi:hypothetical protein